MDIIIQTNLFYTSIDDNRAKNSEFMVRKWQTTFREIQIVYTGTFELPTIFAFQCYVVYGQTFYLTLGKDIITKECNI